MTPLFREGQEDGCRQPPAARILPSPSNSKTFRHRNHIDTAPESVTRDERDERDEHSVQPTEVPGGCDILQRVGTRTNTANIGPGLGRHRIPSRCQQVQQTGSITGSIIAPLCAIRGSTETRRGFGAQGSASSYLGSRSCSPTFNFLCATPPTQLKTLLISCWRKNDFSCPGASENPRAYVFGEWFTRS